VFNPHRQHHPGPKKIALLGCVLWRPSAMVQNGAGTGSSFGHVIDTRRPPGPRPQSYRGQEGVRSGWWRTRGGYGRLCRRTSMLRHRTWRRGLSMRTSQRPCGCAHGSAQLSVDRDTSLYSVESDGPGPPSCARTVAAMETAGMALLWSRHVASPLIAAGALPPPGSRRSVGAGGAFRCVAGWLAAELSDPSASETWLRLLLAAPTRGSMRPCQGSAGSSSRATPASSW
jgi:hypothetical protein